MLRKICDLADFKLLDDGSGGFSGYGSTWDNADRAGEIVVKGAFAKTLDGFKEAGFIAVGHEWAGLPVATIADAYEDGKGLFVKGEFHSTEDAQKARTYVRERLERKKSVGLSIGYTLKDSEQTKAGRLLKEIELHEVSIVTVPCNPLAQATGVKGADAKGYFSPAIQPAMTWAALNALNDYLFWTVTWECLFGDGAALPLPDRIAKLSEALGEYSDLFLTAVSALMEGADDDEDAKDALAAGFKQVFAVPARTAGRFDRQLLALLTEVESAKHRADEIVAFRQEKPGRPLFSPERHGQLKALSEALLGLVETTAPRPEPLDTPLLQLQAAVEGERLKLLIACGGA